MDRRGDGRVRGGGVPGATAEPGTAVPFRGHDLFRARDGRFTEYWGVSGALGPMTALGAVG